MCEKKAYQTSIDRLKRGDINCNFFLFVVLSDDCTTIYDEPILRDFLIQLQALLCRSNRGEHTLAIDSRLDVGRRPKLVRKHLADATNLVLWRDDK